MNKVNLPLATTPTPQSGATQTAQTSTLASYPQSLTSQATQEQIAGTVKGQTPQGQLLVQTLLGDLTVNTQVKLPPGTEILIQFRTHRPPFEVLIVPQGDRAKSQTADKLLNPADKLSLGHKVQATLLTKPAEGSAMPLPKILSSIQSGTSFPIRMEVLGPPPQSAAPQVKAASAPSVQPSSQAQISTGDANKVLNQQAVLKATVSGSTQGNPVVQTAAGNIQLAIKANLPVGTQISLTLIPQEIDNALRGSDPSNRSLTQAGTPPGQDLKQTLQAALSTLIQTGQGNALASHLPHKGPALTSGILLFLNALKGGTAKGWAGEDTLSLLRAAGRTELAQKLVSEGSLITRPVETGQGEWRMTQLPILHEGVLQQANLFVRDREHNEQGKDQGDKEEVTRFKLEIEMSRDGEMQFDGLVKQSRFDLVVRSRNSLPKYMEAKISELFYGANEATGFAGKLTFEASESWEKLTKSSQKLIAGSHNSTMA